MEKIFYEIYKDLYEFYRRHWTFLVDYSPCLFQFEDRLKLFRVVRWITEAIEDAITELDGKVKIRPDAKHFLLINFHQMVILPLIHRESKEIDLGELQNDLKEDVKDIILNVMKEGKIEYEITGSEVMKATARIIEKMRINRLELWG
jgi:hypothetical protein